MVIYFGKINLNSEHIFKVYKKEIKLDEILSKIFICLKDGNSFEKEEVQKVADEIRISTTTYNLKLKDKTETYISGYIYKDAIIYFKQYNEKTKELEWKHVVSNETAEFYFDVYYEKIGYLTSNRFGYREFLEAFEGILNNSLKDEDYEYRFTVELLTTGMNIEDIKEELRAIENIQKLKIKIQPPNIQDELMNQIEKDVEDTIKNFEEAKIAKKSIILTSSSAFGLKIESKEIYNQLEQLNNVHSKISASNLTKNGYVEVEATDQFGNRITTGEKKAIKKEIDNIIDFYSACNRVIKKGMQGDGDAN